MARSGSGLKFVRAEYISNMATTTPTGTAHTAAAAPGTRNVDGLIRAMITGKTSATAAPVPKLWLAASMQAAAATARPTPSGRLSAGAGTMRSNARSVHVVARAWP